MAGDRWWFFDKKGNTIYAHTLGPVNANPMYIQHVQGNRYLVLYDSSRLHYMQIDGTGVINLEQIRGSGLGITSKGIARNERFLYLQHSSLGLREDWFQLGWDNTSIANIQVRVSIGGAVWDERTSFMLWPSVNLLLKIIRYFPYARTVRSLTTAGNNFSDITRDEKYLYLVDGGTSIYVLDQEGNSIRTISTGLSGINNLDGIAYNGRGFLCCDATAS